MRIAGCVGSNVVKGSGEGGQAVVSMSSKKLYIHRFELFGSRNGFECFNKLIASNAIKLKSISIN
jgi:hypothetical protein